MVSYGGCTLSPAQREGFSKFNKIYEFDFNIFGQVGSMWRWALNWVVQWVVL